MSNLSQAGANSAGLSGVGNSAPLESATLPNATKPLPTIAQLDQVANANAAVRDATIPPGGPRPLSFEDRMRRSISDVARAVGEGEAFALDFATTIEHALHAHFHTAGVALATWEADVKSTVDSLLAKVKIRLQGLDL